MNPPAFHDLARVLAEFAAVPVRVQEQLDQAWIEDLAWFRSLRHGPLGDPLEPLLESVPELIESLAPLRSRVGEFEFDCRVSLRRSREVGFALAAQPVTAAWQTVFGTGTPPPALGVTRRWRRVRSRETRMRLSVHQIPLPAAAPAAAGP